MDLSPNVDMPWLCIGDFNALLRREEKKGGRILSSSSSRGLMHFMNTMNFVDLGYVGSKFPWCNERSGLANIRERLDRGIANIPWRVAYLSAIVQHYPLTNSDHVPLVLALNGLENSAPKAFKFQRFWLRDSSCLGVVASAWHQCSGASPALSLFKKIRATQYALWKGNKVQFGNIQQSLRMVKDQLAGVQQASPTMMNFQLEQELLWELDEQLKREELL